MFLDYKTDDADLEMQVHPSLAEARLALTTPNEKVSRNPGIYIKQNVSSSPRALLLRNLYSVLSSRFVEKIKMSMIAKCASDVDYDSVEAWRGISLQNAKRANDLLESVTGMCRSWEKKRSCTDSADLVSAFGFLCSKLRFLVVLYIQLAISLSPYLFFFPSG